MIDLIINILEEQGISTYLINECTETSEEVFFIRQNLDMTRAKDITKYTVTLYRDFPAQTENDSALRGFASCTLQKSMSRQELESTLRNTYESASYAKNPYFPLPEPASSISGTSTHNNNQAKTVTMEQCVRALFSVDTDDTTFINSAEFFITTTDYRIINSLGIDVSFTQTVYSGEFVAQSKQKEDVEIYQNFHFSDSSSSVPETDIPEKLAQLAASTLQSAKDRSVAVQYPNSAAPSAIILEGYCVAELFQFFLERCDASMIYPGYSNYTVGSILPLKSDTLNLTLKASAPYTLEGIKLKDTQLIRNNQITAITGDSRFSYYLGVQPLGTFSEYRIICGSKSAEEFQKGSCLRIVNFSDFQMDSLSGQFGGEFRLAYYSDSEHQNIPVTGGSVSGNILDILDTLMLSKESINLNGYSGPKSVCYFTSP